MNKGFEVDGGWRFRSEADAREFVGWRARRAQTFWYRTLSLSVQGVVIFSAMLAVALHLAG